MFPFFGVSKVELDRKETAKQFYEEENDYVA
jgi:hypothetical protein